MADHWLTDGKELAEFHILHGLFTQLLLKLFKLSVFQSISFLSFTLPPPLCLPMEGQQAKSCVVQSCQLHKPHQPSRDPGCSKNYRICDMIVEDTRLGSWQDLGKIELLQYFSKLDQETCWRLYWFCQNTNIYIYIYTYTCIYIVLIQSWCYC